MRDCAMIKFGVFGAADEGHAFDFHVPVWRRRAVCAALALSEHQLVEFCILLGCDFTASHDLHNNYADYRSSLGAALQPGEVGPFVLEEGTFGLKAFTRLLSLVRAQGGAFTLRAAEGNAQLQLAIQYSRAFFDLDEASMGTLATELVTLNAVHADLEELGLTASEHEGEDPNPNGPEAELLEGSDDGAEEEDHSIRVPEGLEAAFLAWLDANPPQQFIECAPKVLQFCTALHEGGIAMPVDITSEALPLQPDHIAALGGMLQRMQAPDRVIDEHPHCPMPYWEMVVAGKAYQDLLYRALRVHFPTKEVHYARNSIFFSFL